MQDKIVEKAFYHIGSKASMTCSKKTKKKLVTYIKKNHQ